MGRNVGDPICPPVMVHGVPGAFPRCRPWAAPPARSDVGFRSAVVFCPFPVDGMWSCWSSWSTCSATCGGGHYMRTRSCTNPAPAYGGDICLGLHTEEALCNTQPCPGKQPLPAQRRGQGDFGLPLGKDCPQCRRSRFIPGSGRSAGEGRGYPLQFSWASLVAQQESACSAGDLG